MNVQVHHVIVHTPEQAREIVAEAGRIADDAGVDGDRWQAVFEQACALLGARHSISLVPQAMPAGLAGLGLGNGRGL